MAITSNPVTHSPMTKIERQNADKAQLDSREKGRLALENKDEIIAPNGTRYTIGTGKDTANQKFMTIEAANKLMTNYKGEDGFIVLKKSMQNDDNYKDDIALTVYYQDKKGIDILQDGGGYTADRVDDFTNIMYQHGARNAFIRNMNEVGNAAQDKETAVSIARLEESSPRKNAITLVEAEKTLSDYLNNKKMAKINDGGLLALETKMLKKQNSAEEFTQADQDLLNAVRRLMCSPGSIMRIDADGNKSMTPAELDNHRKYLLNSI